MTTPTKPKSAKREAEINVKLNSSEMKELLEGCFQLDQSDFAAKEEAGRRLQGLLDVWRNRYNRLGSRPYSSHVQAELEPIQDAAEKLASLLDPFVMSDLVRRLYLGGTTGEGMRSTRDFLLKELVPQCKAAIDATKHECKVEGAGGGALKRAQMEAKKDARNSLLLFFQATAVKPDDRGCRDDFLNRCLSKIAPVERRQKKSKDPLADVWRPLTGGR